MSHRHRWGWVASRFMGAWLGLLCLPLSLMAAGPAAINVLPVDTLVYISIPNAPALRESLSRTQMGRMIQDPQLAPLAEALYGTVLEAGAAAEDQIGIPLSQLQDLPQGEVTVALIPRIENRPTFLALFDCGDNKSKIETMIDKQMERLANEGRQPEQAEIEGVASRLFPMPGEDGVKLAFGFLDKTLVVCGDSEIYKTFITRWKGPATGDSFATNPQYVAIMKRATEFTPEDPHIFVYADPINTFRGFMGQETAARVALAALPALGLDGVLGVGGTMTFAGEKFDTVTAYHLLLDNPRSGVPDLIAFEAGDTAPEGFVAADVSGYFTAYWDIAQTKNGVASLVDMFQGQGFLDGAIAQQLEQFDLDLQKDVLSNLSGRYSMLTWYEPPARVNSNATLLAIKIKDKSKAKETLAKVVKALGENVEEKFFSGATYYQLKVPDQQDPPPGIPVARQVPCFGLYQDYVLISDRPSIFEKAVITTNGGADLLADAIDFKLIASTVRRQSGGVQPGMISFARGEDSLRAFYEMANDPSMRAQLAENVGDNPFFMKLLEVMEEHPLPPFSVIQQYMAPSGGLVIDDETGIHYFAFTLQRETPSAPADSKPESTSATPAGK